MESCQMINLEMIDLYSTIFTSRSQLLGHQQDGFIRHYEEVNWAYQDLVESSFDFMVLRFGLFWK